MSSGSRSLTIILGICIIGIFGGAYFMGGWVAYGIAAFIALVCTVLVTVLQGRSDSRVLRVLEKWIQGDTLDKALCVAEKTAFGKALCELAEVMEARQRETLFFKKALGGLGNPALVCGVDGRIQLATPSLLKLLKKSSEKVIGLTVSQAFYNKEGASITEQVLASQKALTKSVDITLWDGRTIPVMVFANLINDGERVAGVVTSFIELEELEKRQREIEEQQRSIAEAGERISGLAEHVASATELLSASADDQAQGAQKQKNQTSSVALAMEQMTETVIEVAQNASATSEAADEALSSATEGVTMVSRAVNAINQVSQSAEQLGRDIGELDDQAGEIGRIIGVINDIADQTNLLALNAAIEAARAGEAGRGFAVVADEVRKLAEKTVAATKEVEEAIGTIQNRSRHATESMSQTKGQVDQSTELSNQAGETLQRIMESIQGMVGRVAQIATAAEEQSSAAEQINGSIEEIALIAGDADEAAGQAASATRELAELAQQLLEVSKGFRDGDESKLRESDGQMKGILPKLAQEFVKTAYGDEVYQGMQEELGNPTFLPTDSYPDQVLVQMAENISAMTAVSIRDFFLDLGRYTVPRFNEMYPGHFKDESLKSFYMRMNDVHSKLTKDNPGIKPPVFSYEDKGDDLFMNYRSGRGLFDYFEGILLGAAEFKGEKVTISVKPFDDTTARAEIVFHGKAS